MQSCGTWKGKGFAFDPALSDLAYVHDAEEQMW